MNALQPATGNQIYNMLEIEPPKDLDSDSLKMWKALHECFDYFNEHLFDNRLDRNAIILSCERSRILGHFWPGTWTDENGLEQKSEIALNPEYMDGRSFEEIMSTFVHEMCHFEQFAFGEPGKRGYHNREWADMMLKVGLQPFNVKEPKKETGMRCSHKIVEDGKFSKMVAKIPEAMRLPFLGVRMVRAKATGGYFRWHCPECQQLARAKANASLVCGECSDEISLVRFACFELGIVGGPE
jgi:predicted SprT family Zn-dependent metalloprotease